MHDIADPYFSSIAAGVTLAADHANLAVTLASTQHDPSREPTLVGLLTRQRVRAIVIAGGRRGDALGYADMRSALNRFLRSGGSVAVIGQPMFDVNTVVIGNQSGAAALARALHSRGYRRFGILAGPADHLTAQDRSTGFAATLAELGSPCDPAAKVPSEFTRDGGYEAMKRLLTGGPGVEVVFAVNDVMAVGAMAAARDLGVSVPNTVGVAGFDDIVNLRDITPALTTVRVPLVEAGITATKLALAAPTGERRLTHVETTVVLRESTPGPSRKMRRIRMR